MKRAMSEPQNLKRDVPDVSRIAALIPWAFILVTTVL